jgi:hypothetical protein
VSLFNQGKAARSKSLFGHNTGTTTEDVYICPNNCTAEITYLHIHNTTGNTSITIEWFVHPNNIDSALSDKTNANYSTWKTSGYTSHYLEGKNLGAGEYITFADMDLVLQPGDKLQVTPDTAAHIDTILTVTETFIPVG